MSSGDSEEVTVFRIQFESRADMTSRWNGDEGNRY